MNSDRSENDMTIFSSKIVCTIFVVIISLIISGSSRAGSGPDHRVVWDDIIGVRNSPDKNHPLRNCWDTFQKAIDDEKGVPYMGEIKREFEVTCSGECRHRTYFHWGFHANDKRIKKILSKCIKKWNELPGNTQEKLLLKLTQDTAERNKGLIKELKVATNLTRTQASPITAILYDAHILLDWGDKNTRPLALPKDLLNEIDNDIAKISRGPAKTYNLGKNIRKNLKACYASGATDKIRAENMLNLLRRDMSQLIWEKYGNKFSTKMKDYKK